MPRAIVGTHAEGSLARLEAKGAASELRPSP